MNVKFFKRLIRPFWRPWWLRWCWWLETKNLELDLHLPTHHQPMRWCRNLKVLGFSNVGEVTCVELSGTENGFPLYSVSHICGITIRVVDPGHPD